MKQLTIDATVENWTVVAEFVTEILDSADCSMKAHMQIEVAAEEIYVNIAHYAYSPEIGQATISVDISDDRIVTFRFEDSGIPFNPLAKEDADITLAAEDRKIGGLGIFMVKKTMDSVDYAYENGKNIFTFTKQI